MPILLAILALIVVASIAGAVLIVTQRTTINVIIRKDPDMATIKERLAALETARDDHDSTLANIVTVDQFAVVKSSVDQLTDRVNDIDADIGTDPIPAPAADPVLEPAPAFPAADATIGA